MNKPIQTMQESTKLLVAKTMTYFKMFKNFELEDEELLLKMIETVHREGVNMGLKEANEILGSKKPL